MPKTRQSEEPQSSCLRCGDVASHRAKVPHASIHQKYEHCPHGFYCATCAHKKEKLTLPQCECRALICGWDPPLPPPRRPSLELASQREGANQSSSQSENEPNEVIERAVAAIDKLISTMGRPSNAGQAQGNLKTSMPAPQTHLESNKMREENRRTGAFPRNYIPSLSSMSSNRPKVVHTSADDSGAEPSSSKDGALADALKLRGGRPRRPKPAPATDGFWNNIQRGFCG